MNRQTSIAAILGAIAVATLVAIAGSDGGASVGNVPVFVLCAVIAFAVQWLAFVPAYLRQTEHFFDLTGSLTFLAVIACALGLSDQIDGRTLLLAALVSIWAVRLGLFLFRRITKAGSDRRFEHIKPDPMRFLMTWSLQGLWVVITLAAALAAITSLQRQPLAWPSLIGFGLWCCGFAIEVSADRQKHRFGDDPRNNGRFIRSGLWAWSRHPNYFGEILLWIGITIIALPVLSGWQWVTVVSPVFVILLLTRISGIPMLEARADRKWADDPEYQAYKARTPVLVLRPPN